MAPPDRWKQRLAEIGIPWPILPIPENPPASAKENLTERVKELSCLYALSRLNDNPALSLDDYLAAVVDILPASWQYPETACASIRYGDRIFHSLYFHTSAWKQTAPIRLQDETAGEVTVYYEEARPAAKEGPFLQEERLLLNEVADRIGRYALRRETEKGIAVTSRQLVTERAALREANAALRAVMARIQEEKAEIHQDIDDNVRKILIPILQAMAHELPPEQRKYVSLLRENLENITSGFVRQISQQHRSLTPVEIRICDMIRSGLSSKEIAGFRGVSVATIHRHRENIRRKLGLINHPVNLATYLQSTM